MLCSVFTNLGITASAADTTAIQSENGITYTLDQTAGTLIISGTGPMTDYAYAFGTPWAYKKSYVKSITIEEGVTHIGNYSFASFPNLTSVTIPSTVANIGQYAFHNCSATIYGYADSTADTYATANGLTFVAYGDINGDGKLSIRDATYIQMYIAKMINTLPIA